MYFLHFIKTIGRADLLGHLYREAFPFHGLLHRFQVYPDLIDGLHNGSGRGTRYQDLIAYSQGTGLHLKLGDTDSAEVFDTPCHVHFLTGSTGAIFTAPFTQPLSQIVAIPETAIKDPAQTLVPNRYLFLIEGTFDEEKIAVWDERLRRVFNRGFWDGYYLGQRLGEWSSKYGSGATRKKVYVARGIKYFSGIGVAEFEMESGSLRVGDEILVTGPTTGAVMQTVDEIRVDLKPVEETVKGERFSIKMSEKIRPSDRLYKMEKVQIEKELR